MKNIIWIYKTALFYVYVYVWIQGMTGRLKNNKVYKDVREKWQEYKLMLLRQPVKSQDTDSQSIYRTQRKTKRKLFFLPAVDPSPNQTQSCSISRCFYSTCVTRRTQRRPLNISSEFPQQRLCTAAPGTLTNAYSDWIEPFQLPLFQIL